MDPRFKATPPEVEIGAALALWTEMAGRRVRPLFVSAFGDIYVETEGGEVWVADPLELRCESIAPSPIDFGEMFVDADWADEQLMSDLVLLAEERGIERAPHQVFAATPHPVISGGLCVEHLMPLDLVAWHRIATDLRRLRR